MPLPPLKVLLPDPPNLPSTAPPFVNTLNRLQSSPETIVLILAVVIGGGAGMGVVIFRYLIEILHHLMLEDLMGTIAHLGAWTLACVPTLGGIVVGLMRWCWKDFGPGISSLIAAVQAGQEVSAIRPVTKMVAAAVSLGSGASLGPEGPSVEIGANLGILLGQALRVSQERQRLLLGAGAAAGLAAGFNAPIAGVFFALEVVLGTTFATSAASVVLLAAVVSALVAQIGLGSQPAFNLPAYEVRSPLELPLYLGLGLFASLVSIAYTQSLKWAQDCFKGQIPGFAWFGNLPREIQPMIGGLCVGLVALQLPQILGVGYETVEAMLRDVEFSLGLLLTLLVVKLLVTAVSLGSGLVGGVFAPAMFLGATLGAAYGKILPFALPWFASSIAAPPAYAMVGMAAVLAASVNAPLTSILLLFEMTRDYRIVLPLMAAVGLSAWLAERLNHRPERGSNLKQIESDPEQDRVQKVLNAMLVGEAMQQNFAMLPQSLPLLQAGLSLIEQHLHGALIVDADDQLVGIVTLQDINRTIARFEQTQAKVCLLDQSLMNKTIGEICTNEILYTYPDELVNEALDRMAAQGIHQLPVVSRQKPHQLLGLLTQGNVALACELALTREALTPYLSILTQAQISLDLPEVDSSQGVKSLVDKL
ncbi:CBS domain-containing protein [Phormidesmis priestleyi ULC007]|uniref:CBS domain-containing protein n=1 Tax=Phormidesmis priestleyi ULC007 TaxID=1920490 RepID=A0A2T1DN07_9CYAN|nr:chloride channel protein [Phormidesmis priestleyi]PSB21878.1 CBS domain-containing protein [Phormidesmis priestleyi ULC007]PZO50534.1 MAG: CBS domain-containing protein [Phormidesmis priestleyi]